MEIPLTDTHIEQLKQQVWKALKSAGILTHPPENKFWQAWIVEEKARLQRTLLSTRPDPAVVSKVIDHTLLKPEAGKAQVHQVCQEAIDHGFASVCVNPVYVAIVRTILQNHPVKTCCVVGFPLGAHTTAIKVSEAEQALKEGAQEIDMVIHIGALKDRDLVTLFQDIAAVVTVCDHHRSICKVIIETALLEDEEKVMACEAAALAGAAYVKTSTGFSRGGATVADVALMDRVVAPYRMGVKASGGIRDWSTALDMLKAGAVRIGASASVEIVTGAPTKGADY